MAQFHIYNKLVVLRKLKTYILEQQQFLGWVVNVAVLALRNALSKDVPHNFPKRYYNLLKSLEVREKARNVFLWWAYGCLTT